MVIRLLTSKYAGTEVKVDGEEYTILRQERHTCNSRLIDISEVYSLWLNRLNTVTERKTTLLKAGINQLANTVKDHTWPEGQKCSS